MVNDELSMNGRVITGGRWGINWQKTLSSKGYPLAHVRSALIKELRVGKEEAAMFWMLEMADMPPEVSECMWADLAVFCSEDIGLANPHATGIVVAAKAVYDSLPKDDARRLVELAHAVCYLARSKKSRYVAELLEHVVHARNVEGLRPSVPDRAIDMHTAEGRAKGRGKLHYLTEAAKLENESSANLRADYRRAAIERAQVKENR